MRVLKGDQERVLSGQIKLSVKSFCKAFQLNLKLDIPLQHIHNTSENRSASLFSKDAKLNQVGLLQKYTINNLLLKI